jgi:hypothetical protein
MSAWYVVGVLYVLGVIAIGATVECYAPRPLKLQDKLSVPFWPVAVILGIVLIGLDVLRAR